MRDAVGYRKPPVQSRFRKGQSGNPRGRPKGRRSDIPYDAVLGQMVTIREDGIEKKVTAAEAFLLSVTRMGLQGDSTAARTTQAALEQAKGRSGTAHDRVTHIVFKIVAPGRVNGGLEVLRIAVKLDRYRDTARMMLEPWIVEKALARLGDRRLTPQEQATVYKATRTPHKVKWPKWWTVKQE